VPAITTVSGTTPSAALRAMMAAPWREAVDTEGSLAFHDGLSLTSEAVAEFADRWNLDTAAVEYLNSLDESVKNTVLAEFAPRDNTHDVAGKMYAFSRSIMSQKTNVAQMTPELEAFAARWSLDGAAVAWLVSLPQGVLSVLMEQFEPKEDTHNIIGKMRSFARSIQARIPARGMAEEANNHGGLTHRLNDFAVKWGLEESAVSMLRTLPQVVQQTCIEEFDPKGDVVNVSGKLCAFARSIAAGRQHASQDVVDAFAMHWGLDAGTTQFLRALPQEARSIVIEQFDPMAGTRDVSGRLRKFANGILAKGPFTAPAGHYMDGHATRHRDVLPPWVPPWKETSAMRPTSQFSAGPGRFTQTATETPQAAAMSSDPAIEEFVIRWGLDSSCVSFLEGLPEDACTKVLEQFDPRGNTRNVSAKLRAFANTVVDGTARRTSSQPPLPESRSALFVGPPTSTSVPSPEEEMAFLETWGLSDNQTAMDVLRRLHPPVRMRVMREFAPGHDTQDVFGKFCGFSASVAKAAAKEGASQLPPLRASSQHTAHPPLAQPLWGSTLSAPAASGSMTPEQFAEQWQLDAGSRALLSGLDPKAQAAVINEFQPRGDVRDVSGKFCAFARSVASRFQSESPGQKRPLSTMGFAGPPIYRPRY